MIWLGIVIGIPIGAVLAGVAVYVITARSFGRIQF